MHVPALSNDEQEAFLQGDWVAKLATHGRSGAIRITPLEYAIKDDTIHFTTWASSTAAANLRNDARASVLIDDRVPVQGDPLRRRSAGPDRGRHAARTRSTLRAVVGQPRGRRPVLFVHPNDRRTSPHQFPPDEEPQLGPQQSVSPESSDASDSARVSRDDGGCTASTACTTSTTRRNPTRRQPMSTASWKPQPTSAISVPTVPSARRCWPMLQMWPKRRSLRA